jgi:hypothetical protein
MSHRQVLPTLGSTNRAPPSDAIGTSLPGRADACIDHLDGETGSGVSVVVPRDVRRGGSHGTTTGLVARIVDGLSVDRLSLMREKLQSTLHRSG